VREVLTRSLRRAKEIPCMIICSGTSRLVVVSARHIPPFGPARDDLLLGLMLGKPHGLGGEGSQANKVAVVSPDTEREAGFTFHFYQIVRQSGLLMDRMECSNAAAASGLFARLTRMALPEEGVIQTRNTATGQRIGLRLPSQEEMWKHPWGIRFELEPMVTETFQACAESHECQVGERTVRYHVVPHGNLFVFCDLDPDLMTPELSLAIAEQASEVAVRLGRAQRPFLPKIIPYRVSDEEHVQAASFFEGERHASMPGSAAMALALFLSLIHPNRLSRGHCQVHHRSGQIPVSIGTTNGRATYTEFETPVRLLLHGSAPVPPEHSFMLEDPE